MGIDTREGYAGNIRVGEVELRGHPDVLGSGIVDELVHGLAETAHNARQLPQYRADICAQVSALERCADKPDVIPVAVSLRGQIVVPDGVNVAQIAHEAAVGEFDRVGHFRNGVFHPDAVIVDARFARQSPDLNATTSGNAFGDSGTYIGHYYAEPYGIAGTTPPLIIGQQVDRWLGELVDQFPIVRDGKVETRIHFVDGGYVVDDISIAVAHLRNVDPKLYEQIQVIIQERAGAAGYGEPRIRVNPGGVFDNPIGGDAGVNGKKDGVLLHGGHEPLGTDGFYGKDFATKASSTATPWAFALSRAVAEATGSRYSSVTVEAEYSGVAQPFLSEIDHNLADLGPAVTAGIRSLPTDRDGIQQVLGLKPNEIITYRTRGGTHDFHRPDQPWKRHNPEIFDAINRKVNPPEV